MEFILNIVLLMYLYSTYSVLDDIWLNHCLRKRLKHAKRSLKDRLRLIKTSNKVSLSSSTVTPYQKWLEQENIDKQDFNKIFKDEDSQQSCDLINAATEMLNKRELEIDERKLNLFIMSIFVILATLV